ncbi:MAG: sulfatase [Candidatus Aminicenantes bacterium]|jgi:arylsulfatase A-like enzyme
MKRRAFVKTMGQAAAALSLPQFWSACQSTSKQRPNILWIEVEDVSPLMSCYGYDINSTPNLDRMAENGVLFTNTFMPAPVCSPCRSALITGVMQTSLGTHNHHSSRSKETAIFLPDNVKTLPELFRQAGYFTFNQGKDDYNFWYDRDSLYAGEYTTHALYGKSGKRNTGWKDRQPDQPFFGQIQLSGGKHIYRKNFKERVRNPVNRYALNLPPYYPDHPLVREDWAKHLDSIQITDDEVGKIVDHLRSDGLLENTIIFFFSDHGMRLWRHKQFCYDSGLHVPFIMSWPGNPQKLGGKGTIREDLVNGIDIAATSLALAGIEIPDYMESRYLFARGFKPREHVISARDRCDFTIDRIRTVRTKRFRYIRNFFTDRPFMQPNYRDTWELTQIMRKLHAEGQLDAIQDRFWSDDRPGEELYDLQKDPHETENLADDPKYADELKRHRTILDQWISETEDKGQYPEDIANLKYMFDWWGEKCVNPEYDRFRK